DSALFASLRFTLSCSTPPRDIPSLPTRRSSDLSESMADFVASLQKPRVAIIMVKAGGPTDAVIDELASLMEEGELIDHRVGGARSEEHTSELQSRFDLVCRLLLAKQRTRPRRAC